jgi:hypothetical protein
MWFAGEYARFARKLTCLSLTAARMDFDPARPGTPSTSSAVWHREQGGLAERVLGAPELLLIRKITKR